MSRTNGKMNIRNYTSVVSPAKSRALIEELLVKAGATEVTKMYKDQQVVGYIFRLPVPDATGMAQELKFRMPCEVEAVEKILKSKHKSYEANYARRMAEAREQAQRTAWKLLSEWVHLQLSMIALHQVEPLQAFMPYAYDEASRQTYYEALKARHFAELALPAGKATEGEWRERPGNPDVVEWSNT